MAPPLGIEGYPLASETIKAWGLRRVAVTLYFLDRVGLFS